MTKYPTCNQVKTSGTVCESPALKGSDFCYFHSRDLRRRSNFQQAREVKLSQRPGASNEAALNAEIIESLQLPLLEDANAIQVVLTNVARAIASHHIAERRGALLLYALQIAVSNVSNLCLKLWKDDPVALTDPDPICDLNPLAASTMKLPPTEQEKAS